MGRQLKDMKQEPQNLKQIKPSKEEVEEARKILEGMNSKQKRARMGSMASWAKSRGDVEAQSSRGEVRQTYLHDFMVHQLRQKDHLKTEVNSREISHKQKEKDLVFWWSKAMIGLTLLALALLCT